jgi:hypothetical protein
MAGLTSPQSLNGMAIPECNTRTGCTMAFPGLETMMTSSASEDTGTLGHTSMRRGDAVCLRCSLEEP